MSADNNAPSPSERREKRALQGLWADLQAKVPNSEPSAQADWPDLPGYEILGVLGCGGMGIVFEARQKSPDRIVALKVIKAGRNASPEDVQRFQREAHAAANASATNHENVVTILEVGEANGLNYYCMPRIEGGSLDAILKEYAAEKSWPAGTDRLPNERIAEWMEGIARGVQAIHERGICHRDLKPANILMQKGTNCRPMVADFGLSKFALSAPIDGRARVQAGNPSSELSGDGLLGTLGYLAPEQSEGAGKATALSDIWSLGALLYHLLTGQPPFFATGDGNDYLRRLKEDSPIPPRQLNPKVHPYLEAICLKCLKRNPEDRYASASVLAADLKRFPEPPHLVRAVSPNRRLVRTGLLSLGAALGLLLALVVKQDTAILAAELDDLWTNPLSVEVFNLLDGVIGAALVGMMGGAIGWAVAECYDSSDRSVLTAFLGMTAGSLLGAMTVPDMLEWFRPEVGMKIGAFLGAAFGASIGTGGRILTPGWFPPWTHVAVFAVPVLCVTLIGAAVGTQLAGILGQNVGLFSLACVLSLGMVTAHCGLEPLLEVPRSLRYSRRTRVEGLFLRVGACLFLLAFWGCYYSDQVRRFHGHPHSVDCAAFSPDGRYVVSGGTDGTLQLWDTTIGKRLFVLSGHTDSVRSVAFSPDGRYILSGSMDRTVRLWDARAGTEIRRFPGNKEILESVAFSPDGRGVVSGDNFSPFSAWDVETGEHLGVVLMMRFPAARFATGWQRTCCLAFSTDGRYLVTINESGEARIWSLEGREPRRFAVSNWASERIPFEREIQVDARPFPLYELRTARGQSLVSFEENPASGANTALGASTLGILGSTLGQGPLLAASTLIPANSVIYSEKGFLRMGALPVGVGFSPDGSELISVTSNGSIRRWDVKTVNESSHAHYQEGTVKASALTPDGRQVLLAGSAGLTLYDDSERRIRKSWKFRSEVQCVAVSMDGRHAVAGCADGTLRVWRLPR
jgi:serine/threonine protein kinase/WD40 repeat protein